MRRSVCFLPAPNARVPQRCGSVATAADTDELAASVGATGKHLLAAASGHSVSSAAAAIASSQVGAAVTKTVGVTVGDVGAFVGALGECSGVIKATFAVIGKVYEMRQQV